MRPNLPFIHHYLHDVEIAFESIVGNKLKSFLTTLGIIFGVGAVISMMAIGRGAKQEIMDQIKMVGVNNIVIAPLDPEKAKEEEEEGSGSGSEKEQKGAVKFSPGLNQKDAMAIRQVLPHVLYLSSEAIVSGTLSANGLSKSGKMVGVDADYFRIFNLSVASGSFFTEQHQKEKMAVCVIGHNVRAKFFNKVPAIGSYIKFNDVWLKVIGVLQRVGAKSEYNDQIYIPINSFTLRYKARSGGSVFRLRGGGIVVSYSNSQSEAPVHELSRIIVQMEESGQLPVAQNVLSRMMVRRHQGVADVEVTVPELLLKQQQRSNDIFNIVLGAIAGISLLVGGIGIMNIMFASVMERTKEIGIRLAIGAKKVDVVAQFLAEAILISVTGGVIGVFLGVSLSFMIERMFQIQTLVSFWSILLSFMVSVAVGVIFGYAPARRASLRDPIESLRYE
ncbi:MAG: ABC transporter permease [Bacteroidetes bacterium]|nr:ABC transporter permease [Bacteroidota bacterium]